MGTIQHDMVTAVVGFDGPYVDKAIANVIEFAKSLDEQDAMMLGGASYTDLIVGPVSSIANFYFTYTVLPDGSKEGWTASNLGDELRRVFWEEFDAIGAYVSHVSWGELGSSLKTNHD